MTGRVSAIVLAGGRARRFGAPKLDAIVDGVPLLHHAIRAVAAVADEVVVVAAPGASPVLPATRVALRVVHDPEPDGGPLLALATGLRSVSGTRALVVGGDMPRLQPAVLRAMLERLPADGPAAILLVPPDMRPPRQTLPMAIRVDDAQRAADAALATGRRSLQALLDDLDPVQIASEVWLRLDPDGQTLVDVDEPGDLADLPPRG